MVWRRAIGWRLMQNHMFCCSRVKISINHLLLPTSSATGTSSPAFHLRFTGVSPAMALRWSFCSLLSEWPSSSAQTQHTRPASDEEAIAGAYTHTSTSYRRGERRKYRGLRVESQESYWSIGMILAWERINIKRGALRNWLADGFLLVLEKLCWLCLGLGPARMSEFTQGKRSNAPN